MTMKHSRSVVDSMVTAMHKEQKPRINIADIQRTANEGFARITASVVHTSASRKNPGPVLQALSEKVGAKVRPVLGSFHSLASSSVGETITGIVTSNPETVAYDAAKDTQFHAVAGNMFMDEEEQLWALRKTEAGDLLVKSRGKEDADIIADLMCSLSSAGVGSLAFEATASANHDVGVRNSLEGGDFITFVNPQTESVEFGAVVASVVDDSGKELNQLIVQASGSETTTMVDRALTLGVFDDVEYSDEGLVDNNTVEASAHTLEFIASYYQRVFQRDPDYFAKFMERWMNHSFG